MKSLAFLLTVFFLYLGCGDTDSLNNNSTFETADLINPFATALLDFFADSYRGDSAPLHFDGFSTGAFIVDGMGTMGILAIKISQPIPDNYPWFTNRVFYLHDDEILYYEIPVYRRSRIIITENNRRLVHLHECGVWSAFDLFGVVDGRLVQTSRLEWRQTFPCEQHPYGEEIFSYFNKNNQEIDWHHIPRFITEEEYNEIIVKYGLDRTLDIWQNRFNLNIWQN